ncbi:MAG: PAS domain S-box protein [Proteobacteria bacterium]|jgi:PAS domain S-box-containing protein|nr:PAS domain S-box protein [Pseudomonadota bacterium]
MQEDTNGGRAGIVVEDPRSAQDACKSLAQNIPGIVYRVHLRERSRMEFLNDMLAELTGYSPQDLVHGEVCSIDPLIHPDDRPRVVRAVGIAIEKNEPFVVEYRFRTRKGDMLHFEERGRPTRGADGNPLFVEGVIFDVTERRRREEQQRRTVEALKLSEEKYRTLTESLPVGVYEFDIQGRFLYVNRTAAETFGYSLEEALTLRVSDLITEENRAASMADVAQIMQGASIAGQRTFFRKDGTKFIGEIHSGPIIAEGRIVGIRGILFDITIKRRLEEELARSDKLESIGLLAGGIAHDFNNILTAILGNLSLAQDYVSDDGKAFHLMGETEKACLRARALTRQLLSFSKSKEPRKKTVLVEPLLREAVDFALHGANIRAEFRLQPDLSPIEADEGQITQVLNNLVINAVQAMPHGGLIRIEAANVAASAQGEGPLASGQYVKLQIHDQGSGISPEDLHRIFNPYFTTKKTGSGLGLAICHSIVKQHDGHIEALSSPGEGTTFNVYLPVATKRATVDKPPESPHVAGNGRILVMDDEDCVREVACRILNALGYETEAASDGAVAIDMFARARESGPGFDAVLMDLTVPGGMGGAEAAERIRERFPDAKIVITTGYPIDSVLTDCTLRDSAGFLVKPYTVEEIRAVMQSALA